MQHQGAAQRIRLRLAVPIADEREIVRIAEGKHHIGETVSVSITQIENAGTIDSDRGHSVSVPVTGYRQIAGAAKDERNIGKAIVVTVPEMDGAVARTKYAYSHVPVSVPISGNRNVAGITQVEN